MKSDSCDGGKGVKPMGPSNNFFSTRFKCTRRYEVVFSK